MNIKEKVEVVFFGKELLSVFNENEKEALMKMANEGDLHAACVLVEGIEDSTFEKTKPKKPS